VIDIALAVVQAAKGAVHFFEMIVQHFVDQKVSRCIRKAQMALSPQFLGGLPRLPESADMPLSDPGL